MGDIFSSHKWEILSSLWKKGVLDKDELLDYEDPEVKELMKDQFLIRQALKSVPTNSYDIAEALNKVRTRLYRTRRLRMEKMLLKYAAVALILVTLSISSVIYLKSGKDASVIQTVGTILPGIQKAELFLANGEHLFLDTKNDAVEIKELGMKLLTDSLGGKLCYQAPVPEESERLGFNRLNVPKGGEYSLELPDGSIVWLNSESSLKFPTKFAKDKREVYLEGEAFFKIAKNTAVPFHVYAGGNDIRVLGTRFNVSSYARDQQWQATLIEGAVSVNEKIIMKPSQQYVVHKITGMTDLKTVDTELFTSWVDGKFYFRGFTFDEIVRKLERWYDFNMFYQNEEIKQMRFSGTINKHRPVEEVLQFLEKTTNVRFKVQGKTIIASKE